MKREEIVLVGQLLTAMRDACAKLEEAKRNKDNEAISTARREILIFQKKIGEII